MIDTDSQVRFVPVRCPVCKGFGKVNWKKQICKPCNGKGFIVIDQQTGQVVGGENENKDRQN